MADCDVCVGRSEVVARDSDLVPHVAGITANRRWIGDIAKEHHDEFTIRALCEGWLPAGAGYHNLKRKIIHKCRSLIT